MWASFDLIRWVGIEEAFIDADHLVMLINVLKRMMDDWLLATQRSDIHSDKSKFARHA